MVQSLNFHCTQKQAVITKNHPLLQFGKVCAFGTAIREWLYQVDEESVGVTSLSLKSSDMHHIAERATSV